MIILIRHAQSEGNKDRDIHQTVPDHRIKLTQDGWTQAHEAGLRLRSLLRPDDTLHFFTSPYRRTRETTEGVLGSLTSNDPITSPFPRENITVYEEPRLREQDFGNFQPCSAEMERMWEERADYGHFFYRIPNGESAADAYDRVSGFNESLWRLFREADFASVCVLVTHGLMTRIFLMKWYHFSVEYFEDLRNINHCEFVVMKRDSDDEKYALQNQLRTWSELKKERARELQRERSLKAGSDATDTSPLVVGSPNPPIRRRWGGCPDGCNHGQRRTTYTDRKPPQRKNTKDFLYEYDLKERENQPADAQPKDEEEESGETDSAFDYGSQPEATIQDAGDSTNDEISGPSYDFARRTIESSTPVANESLLSHGLAIRRLGGRDGGGSDSDATSHVESEYEAHEDTKNNTADRSHEDKAMPKNDKNEQGKDQAREIIASPVHETHDQGVGVGVRVGVANSLGDRDDEEETQVATCRRLEQEAGIQEEEQQQVEGEKVEEDTLETAKQYDRSIRGSVY